MSYTVQCTTYTTCRIRRTVYEVYDVHCMSYSLFRILHSVNGISMPFQCDRWYNIVSTLYVVYVSRAVYVDQCTTYLQLILTTLYTNRRWSSIVVYRRRFQLRFHKGCCEMLCRMFRYWIVGEAKYRKKCSWWIHSCLIVFD